MKKFRFLTKVVIDKPGWAIDGMVCYVVRNHYLPRVVYVIAAEMPEIGEIPFRPRELRRINR
jgi:hypothetical protein